MPRMPLNRIDQIAPRSRPGRWRSTPVTFVLRNWSSYVWAAWIGLICDMQRSHFQHPSFSDAFPIGGPFENRSKNAGTIAILNAAPLCCGGSERNAGVSGRGNSVCVRCVFPARQLAAGDTYERSYPKSTSRTPFSPSWPSRTRAYECASKCRSKVPHGLASIAASFSAVVRGEPLSPSVDHHSRLGLRTTCPHPEEPATLTLRSRRFCTRVDREQRSPIGPRVATVLDTLCVLSVLRPDRSQDSGP